MPESYQLAARSVRERRTSSFTSSSEQNHLLTALSSLPHLQTFLHLRNWRWISTGLRLFVFKNRKTAQASHLPSQDWASQWRCARLFGRAGSINHISVANSRTNSFPPSPPHLGLTSCVYIYIHPLLHMRLITENLYGNMASQQLARCNWVRCMIVTSNCSDGKPCHSRVCGCRLRAWLHVCLRVLMGAISFDGTLPVCSWVCVNICGWKGALLKSFLCVNAWAGFYMCLSVYWRICQKQLKVTKKGKATWWLEEVCFYTVRAASNTSALS